MNPEKKRLEERGKEVVPPWSKWGPYVSERSWGTIREDYSDNGDSWSYFPFDEAHKKAYRWGEDGIAGFCDRYQVLAFSPIFWNTKDPILKERLFGLSSWEGNHAEDVKELYYYLDGTPTHSYMKYLYKYPHSEFPYQQLRDENRNRGLDSPEYELIDTGVFDEGRYFDIFIEYAKNGPEEVAIKIEAFNRGKEAAPLHILGQLCFRNQWSWTESQEKAPSIVKRQASALEANDAELGPLKKLGFPYKLGKRFLYGQQGAEVLFTENETKEAQGKDAFHRHIIHKERATSQRGSKAGLHYTFESIPPGESVVLHFLLSNEEKEDPLKGVESLIALRKREADQFYETIHPSQATEEEKKIQRQAFAGLLWSKQIYLFDVNQWLEGDDPQNPPPEQRAKIRNEHWLHLNSKRILLMPDKWEYPWFAAWDLAFHSLTFALIDPEGAKEQLWLLLFDQFQHPNGQIPAYEWEFSDVNPPVQAWAVFHLYEMLEEKDRDFLERCFHKLLMNFAWWVNKVDSSGNNVFEGGFLGMDNISIIDRSMPLTGGAKLQQSDGTGWMALFCLNMMRIALELSNENRVYESLATKFFEHFVYIGHAMKKRGAQDYELWSDQDGFFYDVMTYPDGHFSKFKVRSLVGLIPLFAMDVITEQDLERFPEFKKNFTWFLENRKDLTDQCVTPFETPEKKKYVLSLMQADQIESVLNYVFDPEEFASQFGIRSLSKYHEKHPFEYKGNGIGYEPAESKESLKGGNSNWRGPVWLPINFMIIDVLKRLGEAKVGICEMTLEEKSAKFADGILSMFKRNEKGFFPYLGESFPFQQDPHFTDHLLFHEYFNPETGQGLGASHQTGWTALVANLIADFRK